MASVECLPDAQSFIANGRVYELVMRQRRFYKPFSSDAARFQHEKYAGTEIPKNFSSRVRLLDLERSENREVLISMNNPLRYRGYTFFQSGFDDSDRTSILQVVRNPAAILPYTSCGLVALGLVVQFSMQLLEFVGRRQHMTVSRLITGCRLPRARPSSSRRCSKRSDAVHFLPPEIGRLPVLAYGRIKPLDTVARNSLLIIHGRQTVRIEDGRTISAIEWLSEVLIAAPDSQSPQSFYSPEQRNSFSARVGC